MFNNEFEAHDIQEQFLVSGGTLAQIASEHMDDLAAQRATKKRKRPTETGQVYHHSIRWSVPHTPANLKVFRNEMKMTADKYIFQAEMTTNDDGKENPHYQGYLHRKDKIRSKTLAVQLNDTMRGINIQPASKNGKSALAAYCMKEDTRVAGPWADKKLYLGADLWGEEKQLPWQRSLNVLFAQPPDNRKMIWVYDPVGHNGKTKYIKWLSYKRDALPLTYGHSGDVLNLVSKFPNKNVYCFNLTRSKPANLSELDLYAAMESIKDGMFINMKFETKVVLMNPPHLMVCANILPKYNQISMDRWSIYEIVDSRLKLRNL